MTRTTGRPRRRSGGGSRRVVVLGGLLALAWAFMAPPASGQGVPSWAPSTDMVDGGQPAGAPVTARQMQSYRDPDGGPPGGAMGMLSQAFEWVLGFDPLRKDPVETAPRAANLDAGPPADAGSADGAVANVYTVVGELSLEDPPAVADGGPATPGRG